MDDEDLEDHPESKPENSLFYTAITGVKAENTPNQKVAPVAKNDFKIRGLFTQNFNPNARSDALNQPIFSAPLKAKRETKLQSKTVVPIKVSVCEEDDDSDDFLEKDMRQNRFKSRPKPNDPIEIAPELMEK